jgi:cytosine/adenosine deaminase-related metal-dependent hydrolase
VSTFDIVVRGGTLANPPGISGGRQDVAIADGRIVAVEAEIDPGLANTVVDAEGLTVMPGLVDPHVHVSGRFGRPVGYRMLLRAGVTSALDLAGDPTDLIGTLSEQGCGLTVGVLVAAIPGLTIEDSDPDEHQLEQLLARSLDAGALGLKALGGHFPITPAALERLIATCSDAGAHCAVHAGSTETGSDVSGLEELVALAAGRRVQVAHVNSYCRGQIEDPVQEAARAVAALDGADGLWSDSYLATINGAEAYCADGVPRSDVVKTCLRLGGYEPTEAALLQAIADGWARIHIEDADGVHLAAPDEGALAFTAAGSEIGVSFPVNPPASALAVALAKDRSGSYVVDTFGSDGGSLPRNSTLAQGMALVEAGMLTLTELVQKACREPAVRLGMGSKGHILEGADADLIVVDAAGRCETVLVGGSVRIGGGELLDVRGGTILCSPAGVTAAHAAGVPHLIASV